MPSPRRIILASLCGLPAPSLAGILIALTWGWFAGWLGGERDFTCAALAHGLAAYWAIPMLEAGLGLAYGLVRCVIYDGNRHLLTLRAGMIRGAFVWLCPTIPILLIAIYGCAACYLAPFLISVQALGLMLGSIAIHLLAGALAGLHVEYYLLHSRDDVD